jgi:hypothetical protein
MIFLVRKIREKPGRNFSQEAGVKGETGEVYSVF